MEQEGQRRAQLVAARMPGRCQRDVGAEQRIVADIDMRVVYQRQIEIGVDVFAQMHVMSTPVGMYRRFDIAALAHLSKHRPHHFPLFFDV